MNLACWRTYIGIGATREYISMRTESWSDWTVQTNIEDKHTDIAAIVNVYIVLQIIKGEQRVNRDVAMKEKGGGVTSG